MSTDDSNSSQTDFTNSIKSVFTGKTLVYLVLFLAVYFMITYLFKSSNQSQPISDTKLGVLRFFDIFILTVFILSVGLSYFSKTAQQQDDMVNSMWRELNTFVNEPVSLFSLGLFIFILYLAIYILGIPMDANKPVVVGLMENTSWILFAATLIIVFFNKVLGISITSFIRRMWNRFWNISEDSVKVDTVPDINGNAYVSGGNAYVSGGKKEEVFHISNNLYSYDDAQAVCGSFGARLAKYDEIEQSYNSGAEWCSYGWSEGQMAFFPTQKSTWDKLQNTASHKNDCGRPGVNGGYMGNPDLHFGVNCYGVKPKATEEELNNLLSQKDNVPYAKNAKDIELEQKIQFWKDNKNDLMQLASFNNEKWSNY